MKCKWREADASRKMRDHGLMFLRFCDASAGRVLAEYSGYGKDRLTDFFEGMWEQFNEALNFYADEKTAEATDAADTMIVAQERELRAIGIDPYEIEAEFAGYDRFGRKWRTAADRVTHKNRAAYIAELDRAVRGYRYHALLWMHGNKGFGAKRGKELYRRLLGEWYEFIGHYLECTREDDVACLKLIKDYETELEGKGISFEIEDARTGQKLCRI